jgi:hypothetical protein
MSTCDVSWWSGMLSLLLLVLGIVVIVMGGITVMLLVWKRLGL